MYFNETAFTSLEKKIRNSGNPDAHEDLESVKDIMDSLFAYVETVVRGETEVRMRDESVDGQDYRSLISEYDAKRHSRHEAAISGTKLLNRLAVLYGTEPVFTGDETQRHQIADFCLEFCSWLFANRMRKLS